ncbi:Protein FAM53B [Corvus brachyrhynchos]|uniref:Protein FAM53B n=1 Tax=Corvus brachyrhynchos TaxID=85066 RepID=A0A091FAM9_CORBR|nr:Protein FAM53B [Corvus brachyrhynchos]
MVMILTKTRENKGADSVTCRTELVSFHTPKMSQGPTLFSCGVMDNVRQGLTVLCMLELEQPGASIWDCRSDKGEEGPRWPRDTAGTCSVTNLIKDLSLSDPHGNPSAPPSKRQCRSLSFSDEMSGCGTSWRPLGSKVWTPVEKRRCWWNSTTAASHSLCTSRQASFHFPGSVQGLVGWGLEQSSPVEGVPVHGRGWNEMGFRDPFSPDHSVLLWCDGQGRRTVSRYSSISFPTLHRSEASSVGDAGRRCFTGDVCLGEWFKPEPGRESPSGGDFAGLEGWQRLIIPAWSSTARCLLPPSLLAPGTPAAPEVMPGRTPACTPVPEPPRARPDNRRASRDDLSCEEEEESAGKEEDRAAWRSGGTGSESLFQLDGEIDIEQIENN